MAHVSNINEDILVQLQIIGDISYAWNAIDDFTALMQDRIKTDPCSAIKLRATFLKVQTTPFATLVSYFKSILNH